MSAASLAPKEASAPSSPDPNVSTMPYSNMLSSFQMEIAFKNDLKTCRKPLKPLDELIANGRSLKLFLHKNLQGRFKVLSGELFDRQIRNNRAHYSWLRLPIALGFYHTSSYSTCFN